MSFDAKTPPDTNESTAADVTPVAFGGAHDGRAPNEEMRKILHSFEPTRRQLLTEPVGEAHRSLARELYAHAVSLGRPPVLKHSAGHRSSLTGFAMSPNGRFLATTSTNSELGQGEGQGGCLQIYEVATGQCVDAVTDAQFGIYIDNGHLCVELVRWHHDSTKLFYRSSSTQGHYGYRLFQGEPSFCLSKNCGYTYSTEVSPDGKQLVVSTADPAFGASRTANLGIASTQESREGETIDWFSEPETSDHWECWRFDPTQARLIGFSKLYRKVQGQVLDAATGRSLFQLNTISLPSPGGGLIFSISKRVMLRTSDGAHVWSMTQGSPGARFEPEEFSERPSAVAWSSDERHMAIVCASKILVLRTHDGSLRCSVPEVARGSNDDPTAGFVLQSVFAFNQNGQLGAVLCDEGVSVWSLGDDALGESTASRVALLPSTVKEPCGVGISADDSTVVVFGATRVEFWSVAQKVCIAVADLSSHSNDEYAWFLPMNDGNPLGELGATYQSPFEECLTFSVYAEGAWHWAVACLSGVIVCPEAAKEALKSSLSLVFDDGFAIPACWAFGTALFEIHHDFEQATRSARWPKEGVLGVS